MKAAMRRGADLVGGIPAIEENPNKARMHIEKLFELATEFNRDVDMHIDETDNPASRTLEMLADITFDAGWQGRVSAAHCCSLSSYEDTYAKSVIQKVVQAQINIITNPQVNLVLQGRYDKQPIRRGITRVKELLSAGANVTCGQDNLQDVFYPFGNLDMLEVTFVAAITAQLTGEDEIRSAFNLPRYNAAKCLNLKDYGIMEGARANLVILPVSSVVEALAFKPPRSAVIRDGRVICAVKETVEMLEFV
jgi:cytosine deaminase